jgi:predicted amidophosphoribosyltransferase
MDNTNKDKRTCPFCGKEVKDTDQFCEHCDAYLKAKVKDDETKKRHKSSKENGS